MTRPMPAIMRRLRRRVDRHDDRGAVAVEFALGAPILFGILLILLQVFAWGMGYLAAHAAADQALQTTRVVGGSPAAGRDEATQLLGQLGGRFVDNPEIAVTRGAATTTVTVRGTAQGAPLPITVTVEAPTERYTP
jgi:Flp pilus assembly protein TadG